MEIVTIAVAMAVGATLASLASVLIAVIKKITSTQDKIVPPKFDYKEISDLTTEELEQVINDLEQIKLNRLRTASGN